MLNFAPEKMIMIFLIAMLVLGPEKLPEMARKMGKLAAELRKLSGGFQDEMRQAVTQATSDSSTSSSSSSSGTAIETTASTEPAQVISAGDASAAEPSNDEGTGA